MKARIDIKPLSVNDAWQGRRFKTPDYTQYEKAVLLMLPKKKLPEPPYEIWFTFGFSNPASDIDNGVKPFVDIMKKKYKFNDKEIYGMHIIKKIVPKRQEFVEFEIVTLCG